MLGTKIKEEDKCEGCKGKQTVKDKKILEVHIEKGMRDGGFLIQEWEKGRLRASDRLWGTYCIGWSLGLWDAQKNNEGGG